MTESKNEVALCGLKPNQIEEIENVSKNYQLSAINAGSAFKRAMCIAQGISKLEKIITDEVMEPIMYLKGHKLGFRTDEESRKKSYKLSEVKKCFIEATLRGLSPAGNEWNIIAGNQYTTREGYTALLQKLPGFTDFIYDLGVPKLDKEVGHQVVDFWAKWRMNGTEQELKGRIPLISHGSTSVDALLGKAERKLKYRVHSTATGSQILEEDERDGSDFKLQSAAKSITAQNMEK